MYLVELKIQSNYGIFKKFKISSHKIEWILKSNYFNGYFDFYRTGKQVVASNCRNRTNQKNETLQENKMRKKKAVSRL